LLDALAKAQERKNGAVAPAVTPSKDGAQSPKSSHTVAGLAVAIAIFAVVIIAWHAAPWRAPDKAKIDPSGLKLDRNLDLTRTGDAARSSPPGPARSK